MRPNSRFYSFFVIRRQTRKIILFAALALSPAPILAQTPSGCDKFKWPIDREQAALAAPRKATLENGGELAFGAAAAARLAPLADVHFTQDPQRPPKPGTFAGVLNLAPPPAAGVYVFALSAPVWIDVIQDGKALKPVAFSGALDCPNIRKTLKFNLAASPSTIEISNAPATEVSLVVLPQ